MRDESIASGGRAEHESRGHDPRVSRLAQIAAACALKAASNANAADKDNGAVPSRRPERAH